MSVLLQNVFLSGRMIVRAVETLHQTFASVFLLR